MPLPGSDPEPPGSRQKPKSANTYAWEAVRCYHEVYAAPIWRHMYDEVRALTRADTGIGKITDRCAENAINQMFNDMSQYAISLGCVGECSNDSARACTFDADCPGGKCICPSLSGGSCAACQRGVAFCMAGWAAVSMKGSDDCGSCDLGPRDAEQQFTCPESCPSAQIPCDTWREWCEWMIGSPAVGTATGAVSPIRYGCRQKARPGY